MPKGLYIHIPFCIKKCRYCDFTSYCQKNEYFDKYTDKLLLEASEYQNEEIDTVFIGGGTPTVLSTKQLSELIDGIHKTFKITHDAEFTVESNPKTLDKEKLDALQSSGVNRISIGVQSFCDSELASIGRIHNAVDAIKTINAVQEKDCFDINLDLMLSLPHQTENSLMKTLETAVSLNPSHLSCYSLIIEEGTPLFDDYEKGIYKYPDDDYDRKLYHMTVNYLKNNGYSRYEISNFSKPAKQCRHNLKYWNCDEYIGLGVAAHSFTGDVRSYNTSDFNEYISGKFHTADKTLLLENDKISEYIIMRLRLCDGINENEFFARFGCSFSQLYADKIEKLTDSGLIQKINDNYSLTDFGIDVSNTAMCEFV